MVSSKQRRHAWGGDLPSFHAKIRELVARAKRFALIRFIIPVIGVLAVQPAAAQAPDHNYWVYVAAESADLMHVVRFGPSGATVAKTIPVGESPIETEGPHGLRMSPDGEFLYMTTGHGIPDGKMWKWKTGADTLVAEPILLGYFPATLDITPDGLYAFVANFNLHGERIPSSVSVVYTPTMMEVAQTETCIMPHGGRIHPDGDRLYSACMMDDQIVEIDTRTFDVARRFSVSLDHPAPISSAPPNGPPTCSPTWATPAPDGEHIYVACNAGDEILELSSDSWELKRRFPAGRGPYNLDVTPDGKTLVATLKQGAAIEVFDLSAGKSVGQLAASTTVTHGVVTTPDSRYAFVSIEGVGAEPGKVDVIDLARLQTVASVEVAQQAGGIAFWKMEPIN